MPPSAVRDLYGTAQDVGANKGVLSTTSTSGPGSHAAAEPAEHAGAEHPAADRLVLVAAVDPEANPGGDLSGFTDARIRLSDPSGAAAEELPVSDGRAGETALVLGSFRRRSGSDWHFVVGGKGYAGLVDLVEDYGIEVA